MDSNPTSESFIIDKIKFLVLLSNTINGNDNKLDQPILGLDNFDIYDEIKCIDIPINSSHGNLINEVHQTYKNLIYDYSLLNSSDLYDRILKYCNENIVDYTYIGIATGIQMDNFPFLKKIYKNTEIISKINQIISSIPVSKDIKNCFKIINDRDYNIDDNINIILSNYNYIIPEFIIDNIIHNSNFNTFRSIHSDHFFMEDSNQHFIKFFISKIINHYRKLFDIQYNYNNNIMIFNFVYKKNNSKKIELILINKYTNIYHTRSMNDSKIDYNIISNQEYNDKFLINLATNIIQNNKKIIILQDDFIMSETIFKNLICKNINDTKIENNINNNLFIDNIEYDGLYKHNVILQPFINNFEFSIDLIKILLQNSQTKYSYNDIEKFIGIFNTELKDNMISTKNEKHLWCYFRLHLHLLFLIKDTSTTLKVEIKNLLQVILNNFKFIETNQRYKLMKYFYNKYDNFSDYAIIKNKIKNNFLWILDDLTFPITITKITITQNDIDTI
jgi:hypothetical protein